MNMTAHVDLLNTWKLHGIHSENIAFTMRHLNSLFRVTAQYSKIKHSIFRRVNLMAMKSLKYEIKKFVLESKKSVMLLYWNQTNLISSPIGIPDSDLPTYQPTNHPTACQPSNLKGSKAVKFIRLWTRPWFQKIKNLGRQRLVITLRPLQKEIFIITNLRGSYEKYYVQPRMLLILCIRIISIQEILAEQKVTKRNNCPSLPYI